MGAEKDAGGARAPLAYSESPEERPPWADVRDRFLERIAEVQDAQDTPLRKIPVVNHRELDLLVLYVFTMRRGGAKKVTENMQWSEIYREMKHAPPMTNAAFKLRETYERSVAARLLLPLEADLQLPAEFDAAVPRVMPDRDMDLESVDKRGSRIRKPVDASGAGSETPSKRARHDSLTSRPCERCGGLSSTATNTIVFCSACDRGFHQGCHTPPIPWQAANIREYDWFCDVCEPIRPLVACRVCSQQHISSYNPLITCRRCQRRQHALCSDPPVLLMAHDGLLPTPTPTHTCADCVAHVDELRAALAKEDHEAIVAKVLQALNGPQQADLPLERVYPGSPAQAAAATADQMVLLLLAEAPAAGATLEDLVSANRKRFGGFALDSASVQRALAALVAGGRAVEQDRLFRLAA